MLLKLYVFICVIFTKIFNYSSFFIPCTARFFPGDFGDFFGDNPIKIKQINKYGIKKNTNIKKKKFN